MSAKQSAVQPVDIASATTAEDGVGSALCGNQRQQATGRLGVDQDATVDELRQYRSSCIQVQCQSYGSVKKAAPWRPLGASRHATTRVFLRAECGVGAASCGTRLLRRLPLRPERQPGTRLELRDLLPQSLLLLAAPCHLDAANSLLSPLQNDEWAFARRYATPGTLDCLSDDADVKPRKFAAA